ncbi:MAG TPA: alginate lyase family protein [Pirellulales bacterium]|jgi:hypothetical protein|nr:alginate lyase family protein [Pirellulales bacterium]
MRFWITLIVCSLLSWLGVFGTAMGVAQSISLTDVQRKRLAEIVHGDKDAGAMFAAFKRQADQALNDQPKPIDKIQTEGKLPKDPVKLKTEESLADMGKLEALAFAYAVTAEPKYADKSREFLLVWAGTNHSKGDPIDDTNLEPLLFNYDLTRSTFSADERQAVDAYLRGVAAVELATAKSKDNNHFNNWHSHRLKIVGLIAFLLPDQALIDTTVRMYKEQIEHNIEPDGSTYDFHERDALHYHLYDLAPLLTLAIAAKANGVDLYSYQSPKGGSLGKTIEFLLPYAQGTKTHAEFVNSKVSFDRKRAEAGAKEYQSGSAFQPHSALTVLGLAEFFDPSLLDLVHTLSHGNSPKYPTWQIVLNEVRK